jgi:hypothetical protein
MPGTSGQSSRVLIFSIAGGGLASLVRSVRCPEYAALENSRKPKYLRPLQCYYPIATREEKKALKHESRVLSIYIEPNFTVFEKFPGSVIPLLRSTKVPLRKTDTLSPLVNRKQKLPEIIVGIDSKSVECYDRVLDRALASDLAVIRKAPDIELFVRHF